MLLFIWCVLLIPLAPVGITVGWYVGKCGGEFFWCLVGCAVAGLACSAVYNGVKGDAANVEFHANRLIVAFPPLVLTSLLGFRLGKQDRSGGA